MDNVAAPVKDGQAPARKFGGCVAVVVVLFGCLCLAGGWFLFHREGFKLLQDTLYLQTHGVTTTGTVVDAIEHPGVRPNTVGGYELIVEFNVDGETYTFKGNSNYKPKGSSWVGETMPIIYDPDDPNRALIDTFEERWWNPITLAGS